MAGAKTLEQRLDEAEARTAITDLVHRYARFVRRDEPEHVSALFTRDGTFEVRDGYPGRAEHTVRSHFASPAEIDTFMAASKGKPHPVPLIHNLIVEIDGETATGNCVMEAQIYGGTHKFCGEYRDTLRREDGEWRFASRIYTIFSGAAAI